MALLVPSTRAICATDSPARRIVRACSFWAAVREAGRPRWVPRARAASTPMRLRSRMLDLSISATAARSCRTSRPVGPEVRIPSRRTRSVTPRSSSSSTSVSTEAALRPRRSRAQTTSSSPPPPPRATSRRRANSGRLSGGVLPLHWSIQIRSTPARQSSSFWDDVFWSLVEVRAARASSARTAAGRAPEARKALVPGTAGSTTSTTSAKGSAESCHRRPAACCVLDTLQFTLASTRRRYCQTPLRRRIMPSRARSARCGKRECEATKRRYSSGFFEIS